MEKFLTGIIPSASFYVQDPRLLEIFPTLIHYDGKVNLTGFFYEVYPLMKLFSLNRSRRTQKNARKLFERRRSSCSKRKKGIVVEQS